VARGLPDSLVRYGQCNPGPEFSDSLHRNYI
jgi:hypothetical protein